MEIIISLLGSGLISGAVLYSWKKRDTRVGNIETEVKEIKENYLDRFERVNCNINDFKQETISRLVRIETLLENNK